MENNNVINKDNLSIWRLVQETDRSATRTSNFDGRDITTINATYMVMQATRLFGPIGIGWGYEIVEERIDTGAPIYKDGEILGHEMEHTLRLKFWYMKDGKRGEFEHYGHTPFIQRSKWGPYGQAEAPKKSLTDALKKCLSMLGFSADIFLGLYDDQNYVQAIELKQSIEKADKIDEALAQEQTKFADWVAGEVQLYEQSKSSAALKILHNSHRKKVERQCQVLQLPFPKVWKKFEDAYKAVTQKDMPEVVCEQCGDISNDKPGNICRECGGKKLATGTAAE